LKLELLCYNHEDPVKMDNVSGQGSNLNQSGLYQCPNCGNKSYAQAEGCIAHLIAIGKGNVVQHMSHEIGKEGIEIKIVTCECPNCKSVEV